MRKIITLLLLLVSGQIFSQDLIIKKNGDEIKAKVEEITIDMVKYREFENLTGPLYNIPLADVFMVKYPNGTSKFFGATKEKEEVKTTAPKSLSDTVAQLKNEIAAAKTYSKYDSLMKLSRSNKSGGILGCVVGPLFLVSGAVTLGVSPLSSTPETKALTIAMGAVLLAGGVALTILGPVSLSKSKKQYEAAQQYKGQVYMSIPSLRLNNFGSRAGIGIGTTITF